MSNINPTIHNYISESVSFTPGKAVTTIPHGVDTGAEFAHITPFPATFDISPPFAVHTWVKFTATTSIRARIISTPAKGAGVTTAFTLGLLGDDVFYGTKLNALRVGFGINSSGTQVVKVTSEPVIKPDTWHHIVGQSDDSKSGIEIYVDGCLTDIINHADIDYTPATNTGGTDPTGLVVGWDTHLNGAMDGNIASLAIINRELTSEEIKTLAQGTVNLIGVSFTLKSSLLSWWKMGDEDATGLASLLDSVGTNHLTTVNMLEGNRSTDVPDERPRQHQNLHLSTGCDEFKLDPNGVGCPFLWDPFRTLDNPDTIPRRWFGGKQATDKFERVMIAGRISVLRLAKNTNGNGMYMTNLPTDATGGTLLFGNPAHPDPTEYCLETVVRNGGSGGGPPDDDLYVGFVEDPHSFTTSDPATGVYFHWDGSGNDIRLVVSDSGTQSSTAGFSITDNIFYRLKLCFSYIPDVPLVGGQLRARLFINDVLILEVSVLAGDAAYPIGNGNIFIGVKTNSQPFNVDMSWIGVTFRGIGADNVLGI